VFWIHGCCAGLAPICRDFSGFLPPCSNSCGKHSRQDRTGQAAKPRINRRQTPSQAGDARALQRALPRRLDSPLPSPWLPPLASGRTRVCPLRQKEKRGGQQTRRRRRDGKVSPAHRRGSAACVGVGVRSRSPSRAAPPLPSVCCCLCSARRRLSLFSPSLPVLLRPMRRVKRTHEQQNGEWQRQGEGKKESSSGAAGRGRRGAAARHCCFPCVSALTSSVLLSLFLFFVFLPPSCRCSSALQTRATRVASTATASRSLRQQQGKPRAPPRTADKGGRGTRSIRRIASGAAVGRR
jgi:hypothetical protein